MVSLLLSAALLLGALCACQGPAAETDPPDGQWPSALDVVDAVFPSCGFDGPADVEYLTTQGDGVEFLTAYIENAYGLQEPWEDAAVIRATGASAFEIAVLRMEDESAAVRAATALMSYIFNRQGDFAGYAPDQADMVAQGSLAQDGPYAALFICPDPDAAGAAFDAFLNGGSPSAGPVDGDTVSDADVKGLRDLLVSSQGLDGTRLELLDDSVPDALDAYMGDVYGVTPDLWEAAAIARDPETAFEMAVIRVSNDGDEILPTPDGEPIVFPGGLKTSKTVEQKLNDYLAAREGEFDPASDQGKLLHRAIAGTAGQGDTWYAVLLACGDRDSAISAFVQETAVGFSYSPRYDYLDTDSSYPDRCAFTPPNKDDMSLYDTSAILAAWEAGNPSGLSGYDRDIYDAAQAVLDQVLEDGMSDYEKEFAIYGWVVNNVDYDWTHQNIMVSTPRESFTPYGGLVNRTAVCLGYAMTFQLLCDLAGVECITVVGAAFSSREDHAWNMVRLNGEWYCLDVTWDANYREQAAFDWPAEYWNHFNVTSDEMAAENHQWDYANTPEATATDHGRG